MTLLVALLGFGIAPGARAAIEVVGDGACPYYAAVIESFATCEGDHVARTVADNGNAGASAVTARGRKNETAPAPPRAEEAATAPRAARRLAVGPARRRVR
jgi:hypothetical protein